MLDVGKFWESSGMSRTESLDIGRSRMSSGNFSFKIGLPPLPRSKKRRIFKKWMNRHGFHLMVFFPERFPHRMRKAMRAIGWYRTVTYR